MVGFIAGDIRRISAPGLDRYDRGPAGIPRARIGRMLLEACEAQIQAATRAPVRAHLQPGRHPALPEQRLTNSAGDLAQLLP